MHVVAPRAALLANYEVLALLRDLDADHIARTKSAIHTQDVSENLRTVELEAIQYLAADHHPTPHQSEHAISQLVRDLAPFALTKAEKLQIVNLAPTEPVELYVIVEELEDRLAGRMDQVLATVSKSLSTTTQATPFHGVTDEPDLFQSLDEHDPAHAWEHGSLDAEFDDLGEGIGVQGDLDMEDDD